MRYSLSPCLLCNSGGALHQPPSVEQACRRALGYGCCQLCYLWHLVVWRAPSGQVQRQRSTLVPCTVLSIAVTSELSFCYMVVTLPTFTAILSHTDLLQFHDVLPDLLWLVDTGCGCVDSPALCKGFWCSCAHNPGCGGNLCIW